MADNTLGSVERTQRGFELLKFSDANGRECSLEQSSAILTTGANPGASAVWLGLDGDWMHLSRTQIAALVWHLQKWLVSGSLKVAKPCANQMGLFCPNCGRSDMIDVAAHVFVRLTPDGSDADEAEQHDHEFGKDSLAVCRACNHTGKVGSFEK